MVVQYFTACLVSADFFFNSNIRGTGFTLSGSKREVGRVQRELERKGLRICVRNKNVCVCVCKGECGDVSTDDHRLQTNGADVNHHRSTQIRRN